MPQPRRGLNLLLSATGAAFGAWIASRLIRQRRLDSDPLYFADKVVLITGASKGIGEALAYALAARGACLVLAARSEDKLQAVAAECRSRGAPDVLVVPTDISEEPALQNLTHRALEHFAHVDILINNAGYQRGGALDQVGSEAVYQQITVNLIGGMLLTQLLLPDMLARGSGHIVNISSIIGRYAFPYATSYGASKFGMVGFNESLRRELYGTGINVTLINPTFTETDIMSDIKEVVRKSILRIDSVETVAQRTLEAIQLNEVEITLDPIMQVSGWLSAIAPRLSDLAFRVLTPPGVAEAAAGQHE
ncbi:MAG: SDR family NAD(P)-dependent oxidoreductase [Chloroflexi bacterium]|nr:SDR family NAD(P)-dependent oxidoreductase [Chloroflexota bacterium]